MTKSTAKKGSGETIAPDAGTPASSLELALSAHRQIGDELEAIERELGRTGLEEFQHRRVQRRLAECVRDLAVDLRDLRQQIASLVSIFEAQIDEAAPAGTVDVALVPATPFGQRLKAFVGHALRVFKRAAWAALNRLRATDSHAIRFRLLQTPFEVLPQLTLIVPTDRLSESELDGILAALDSQTDQDFERVISRIGETGEIGKSEGGFVGVLPAEAAALPATTVESLRLLLASECLAFVVVATGAGFLSVVRGDLWHAESGIATDALVALAKRTRRQMLGKALRPHAVGHAFPAISSLLEARRRGHIAWRGPYAARSGGGLGRPHEIQPANFGAAVPIVEVDGPTTGAIMVIIAVPLAGGVELFLNQVIRLLSTSRRVLVVAVAPSDIWSTRRLEQLRHSTPWVYCWGDTFAPPLMSSLVAWLIARHRITSVIDVVGAGLRLGGELRTLFPDLRVVALPFPGAPRSPVGGWGAYDFVLTITRQLTAALAHEAGERVVPFFDHTGGLCRGFQGGEGNWASSVPTSRLLVTMRADLVPEKRPEDFLALAQLFRNDQRFEFLLVGDGPLAGSLDDLVIALGLPNFCWRIANGDLAELLERTDIACTTSESEPFPEFAAAALAAGKPVLGADVDDLGTLLRTGPCGLVVPRPGDVEGFAAQLESLADPNHRRRLGSCGPATAARFRGSDSGLEILLKALAAEQ